jgi:lysophospholipase L1-like esterase
LKLAGVILFAGATAGVLSAFANTPAAMTIEQTAPTHSGPVVVACVGDSITAGTGASDSAHDSPSLLGQLLGPSYKVINFGESGATLLKNGDHPYWKRPRFDASASFTPDVVVIMLGSNDSKPQNWPFNDQFTTDYKALISYYTQLPSHPQIFIALPPPGPGSGNYEINEPVIEQELPLIRQVAEYTKSMLIDVYSGVPKDSSYFVDNVHPNDNGYIALAGAIYIRLTHSPVIEPITDRINATGTTVPPTRLLQTLAGGHIFC